MLSQGKTKFHLCEDNAAKSKTYCAHKNALSRASRVPPIYGLGGSGSKAIHHPTGILTVFIPCLYRNLKSSIVIKLFLCLCSYRKLNNQIGNTISYFLFKYHRFHWQNSICINETYINWIEGQKNDPPAPQKHKITVNTVMCDICKIIIKNIPENKNKPCSTKA